MRRNAVRSQVALRLEGLRNGLLAKLQRQNEMLQLDLAGLTEGGSREECVDNVHASLGVMYGLSVELRFCMMFERDFERACRGEKQGEEEEFVYDAELERFREWK